VFVSIVIATRNRKALLGRTLDVLAGQQWPADQYEIIVADNGSTDGTPEAVERAMTGEICVRYLFVPTPGKSHAVNAALGIARGDLIAFTDDDVQPSPEWVAGMPRARPFAGLGLPRIGDIPEIVVEIIPSSAAPGGLNGLSTTVLAPAVANAIYAGTGKRMRSLPFEPMAVS